jgi:hypothetical protein
MQGIAAGRSIALLDRSPPGLSLSAELQAVLSLIWAAGAGFGIIALLRQGGRAALYAQAVLASFVLYTGLRVYIFARADYDRQRLPFLIVVGLCGLLGMFVVLMGDRHRREKNMERSNDR